MRSDVSLGKKLVSQIIFFRVSVVGELVTRLVICSDAKPAILLFLHGVSTHIIIISHWIQGDCTIFR
jgi:hypothetical protein